ncbi:hypothetical protein OAN73_00970 [Candidatus Pelagibacter sp.]|nr:hypothetical protein [Candidatus Pelagibacter sp.]
MSDLFKEINKKTFQIKFGSKINQINFFKYIEKNFQKWGMVDIEYDKIEKTIYGKAPGMALTFWDKFPVNLSSVGLKNIIISEGDEINSYLINVNTNEMFGNSKTKLFADYFSKEINKKFSKLKSQKGINNAPEYIEKKKNVKSKLSAEEKIENVKKKKPTKIIWWILGVIGFFILLFMMFSGGNKSGSGVICYLEGQVDNKPYKFKRECVYTCYVGDRKEKILRYEDMPNNCPSYPKYLN